MSKRFGRNQKRKLKEQIASTERMLSWYAEKHSQLNADFDEWEKRIKCYAGADSSLLPRINYHRVENVSPHPQRYRLHNPLPMPSDMEKMFTDGGQMFVDEAYRVERMYRFTGMLNKMPEEWRTLIRFIEINNQTGESYFSISETEFHRFGLDDAAIRHLAEDIAKKLVHLTNQGKFA